MGLALVARVPDRTRRTLDYDPVPALIAEGNAHAARGDDALAVRCWEEALRHREDATLRERLRALGSDPLVEREELVVSGVRELPRDAELEVVALVQDRRYEEALDALREVHGSRPGDVAVARSIRHLKRHLEGIYRRELEGGALRMCAPPRDAEQEVVARWVDGVATLEDVLDVSPLGRFRTLRTLATARREGLLEVEDARVSPRRETSSGDVSPQALARVRALLAEERERQGNALEHVQAMLTAAGTRPEREEAPESLDVGWVALAGTVVLSIAITIAGFLL